jgi:hypothetical protein
MDMAAVFLAASQSRHFWQHQSSDENAFKKKIGPNLQ